MESSQVDKVAWTWNSEKDSSCVDSYMVFRIWNYFHQRCSLERETPWIDLIRNQSRMTWQTWSLMQVVGEKNTWLNVFFWSLVFWRSRRLLIQVFIVINMLSRIMRAFDGTSNLMSILRETKNQRTWPGWRIIAGKKGLTLWLLWTYILEWKTH